MAFSKKTFTDGQTVIDADTLNAIQDELIRVGTDKSMGLSGLAADDQITASSFRLRTNGSSRCWANGSQIRWIALAM